MGLTKSFFTLEQIRKDNLTQDTKTVETKAKFVRSTNRAILIFVKVVMVKAKVWLPKSQIVEPDPVALNVVKEGDEVVLIIPLWLAKSNNLTWKEIKNENH